MEDEGNYWRYALTRLHQLYAHCGYVPRVRVRNAGAGKVGVTLERVDKRVNLLEKVLGKERCLPKYGAVDDSSMVELIRSLEFIASKTAKMASRTQDATAISEEKAERDMNDPNTPDYLDGSSGAEEALMSTEAIFDEEEEAAFDDWERKSSSYRQVGRGIFTGQISNYRALFFGFE